MSERVYNAPAPPELPRLRIYHLLALTTIFSIMLAMWLGVWRFARSSQPNVVMPEFSSGVSIFIIAMLLSFSVCTAVAMFGLAWWRRGISFPSQPGHWVAIYFTIAWAYEMVLTIITFLPTQGFVRESIVLVMMPTGLVFHCFVAIFWIAAYFCEPARMWKWGWAAMALKSILSASRALFYIGVRCVEWLLEVFGYNYHLLDWRLSLSLGPSSGMWLLLLTKYACAVFFLAAMISDYRHNRKRHWSHWMVLIPVFLSAVVQVPYYHWALNESF